MTETGLKTYLEKWQAGNHDHYGIGFDGTDPAALNECRTVTERQKDQTLDEYSNALNSCMRTEEKNILAMKDAEMNEVSRQNKNNVFATLLGFMGFVFGVSAYAAAGNRRKLFPERPNKKNYTKRKLKS